jgi:hypothetical protein
MFLIAVYFKTNLSNVFLIGANTEIFVLRCVQKWYFLVHLLEMEGLWLVMTNTTPPQVRSLGLR